MKKSKRYALILALALLAASVIAGCKNKENTIPDPKSPVVVTLWHSYNAVAKLQFDNLIQEFNDTVGMEKGIIIDSKGYGSSEELEEVLFASANQVIGSEPLPDIFSSYPDSAYRLDQIVPLVSLENYFTTEELEKYRSEFLEEGVWGDSKVHKMIPVAKSTELLYLNKTGWEQFSAETGVSKELLTTWEGLAETARIYYEWSGGKPFLGMNAYNDFAVLSAAQMREGMNSKEGQFIYSKETAQKAFDAYYVPHVRGWYESRTYNQDGVKSGKLIAYIGSSAGAGFFPEEIIADEENSYPVECECLPYPTFRGGEKVMTQRGANMAVFASTAIRENAAFQFLKWFTQTEQNSRFAISTGYLPVEKKALESMQGFLAHIDETGNTEAIRGSIKAYQQAGEQYTFYVKRAFEGSFDRNRLFAQSLESRTAEALEEVEKRVLSGESKEKVRAELLAPACFEQWYDSLMKEMAGKTDGEKN